MFSPLDSHLFPDDCEVFEIVPHSHYVFPIFKNGSTSIRDLNLYPLLHGSEISSIQVPISVYLRKPKELFLSGVNSFVQFTKRDNPELDIGTIFHFVNRYPFLNLHILPQFFWLANLARFTDMPVVLKSMENINEVTPLRLKDHAKPPTDEFVSQIKKFNWHQLEPYFLLDQLLIDRIGQTVYLDQIIDDLKTQHPETFKVIFEKTYSIVNVLSKT